MENHTNFYGLTQMQVSTLLFRQLPRDITIQEKMLMLTLADHYRDGRPIELSIDDFVTESHMKQRSVSTYLKKLEERGYISKKRVGLGSNNQYTINLSNIGIDLSDYRHQKNGGNVVQLHQVVNG